MLTNAGRFGEAIAKDLLAIRLNPRDPSVVFRYKDLSVAYFGLGDFEAAIVWTQRAVQRNSSLKLYVDVSRG